MHSLSSLTVVARKGLFEHWGADLSPHALLRPVLVDKYIEGKVVLVRTVARVRERDVAVCDAHAANFAVVLLLRAEWSATHGHLYIRHRPVRCVRNNFVLLAIEMS